MKNLRLHLGFAVVATVACSAPTTSEFGRGRTTATGSGTTSSATTGTGSGGPGPGVGQGGAGIGGIATDAGTGRGGSGQVGADAACVAETKVGEQAPVNLYVMQDKSGSMTCPTGMGNGMMGGNCGPSTGAPGPTRWTLMTAALQAFVNSPSNAGIGVGIGFFPVPPAGVTGPDQACLMRCNGDCACQTSCGCKSVVPIFMNVCICGDNSDLSCNAADYAAPAVEIAVLPGAATAITNSINAQAPNGGTPSVPSLDGALQHALSWARSHVDRRVSVIYSTDGEPSGCDANNTVATAANLARTAATGMPPVLTYVIGVGPSLTSLNQIAASGGTTKAYLVDTGGDVAAQLATALNAIKSNPISCDYKIPPSPTGTPDFGLVNVRVQVGPAGVPTPISQVPNKDACGMGPGWYYDNPAMPSLITLCPATCDPLLQNSGSRLDVLIGCKTDVRVN